MGICKPSPARISIVGNSGSGKSTFAAWLARRLGLPVLHIDKLLWQPGWAMRSEEEIGPQIAQGSDFIGLGLRYREVMDLQMDAINWLKAKWMPRLRDWARQPRWITYAHCLQAYEDPRWEAAAG